ncbi:hypothetical protein F0562_006913 [Nyssa sinensis]|uniref:TF-B3 domain-containing protein n=1 Tax=Nyssa sinensis TaxID=561372 RepID=A0A5J5A2W1_9ASTE|nr:hypothetical protein F0562_006913 [Nyssa sinensis]
MVNLTSFLDVMANPQKLTSRLSSCHSLSFATEARATKTEPVKKEEEEEEERSAQTLLIRNRKRKEPPTNHVIATTENNGSTASARKYDAAKTHNGMEEVSTELKLSTGSQITKKIKIVREVLLFLSESELERKEMERRIRSFRFYSYKDEEEERRLGVSTKLKLFEDPWKIKKRLTRSDTNGLCRLMLSRDVVEANIIPFWDVDQIARIETEAGARVIVWDYDTGSAHQLAFKKWTSNPNCIFNEEWSTAFVRRRCLHEGDMIGLFWDNNNLRFGFRVLARASGH